MAYLAISIIDLQLRNQILNATITIRNSYP